MNKNLFFGIVALLIVVNGLLFYKTISLKNSIIETGYQKYKIIKKAKEFNLLKNRFVCKNKEVSLSQLKNALNSNIEIKHLVITKDKATFRCEK